MTPIAESEPRTGPLGRQHSPNGAMQPQEQPRTTSGRTRRRYETTAGDAAGGISASVSASPCETPPEVPVQMIWNSPNRPTAQERHAEHGSEVKLFSFFEELAEPVKKLGHAAWRSRGKAARDVKAYVSFFVAVLFSMPGRGLNVLQNPKLHSFLAEEEDPQALAAMMVGTGGALCLGSVGAVIGATVGAVLGLAVGAVPAFFTLGLSLPIGAALGGTAGLLTGATTGSSAGFVAGATSGSFVAHFRAEIRHSVLYVGSKLYDVYDVLVLRPVGAAKATKRRVGQGVQSSADYTRAKAQASAEMVRATKRRLGEGVQSSADFTLAKAQASAELAREVAADPRVQVSAAGAGVGATALGTAGAASG
ncbi:unnamed protein product, partial [Polarella glacialis]